MSSADSSIVSESAPRFCGECGRPLKAVSYRLAFDRQTGVEQVERRLRCPRNHEDWAPLESGAYINLGFFNAGLF